MQKRKKKKKKKNKNLRATKIKKWSADNIPLKLVFDILLKFFITVNQMCVYGPRILNLEVQKIQIYTQKKSTPPYNTHTFTLGWAA